MFELDDLAVGLGGVELAGLGAFSFIDDQPEVDLGLGELLEMEDRNLSELHTGDLEAARGRGYSGRLVQGVQFVQGRGILAGSVETALFAERVVGRAGCLGVVGGQARLVEEGESLEDVVLEGRVGRVVEVGLGEESLEVLKEEMVLVAGGEQVGQCVQQVFLGVGQLGLVVLHPFLLLQQGGVQHLSQVVKEDRLAL